MAGNGKRGAGDRVLESRHLVGLFLGVVLLCGVFFTLGYVMGRTQYGGAVHAAETPAKILSPAVAPTKVSSKSIPEASKPAPGSDWADSEPSKPADKRLESPAPTKTPAPVPPAANKETKAPKGVSTKETPRFQAPPLNKNSIVLQVAATKQQRDALDMADLLQKKKFTSFVTSSSADNFYHVQVGPYPDLASAEKARHALEQLGFKSIIKR
jgi:DedD protein